jgi:hypothetical protein
VDYHIRAAVEGGDQFVGLAAAEAALCAESGRLRLMRPGEAFDTRSDVRAAITPFVLCHSTAIHRDAALPRSLLACLSLPYATIAAALQAAGHSHPLGVISELAERGLLYLPGARGGVRGADWQVRIARPADAHAYCDTEAPRRRDLLLLTAVQCMTQGIAGEPGDEETHDDSMQITAWNALQQLVRPRVRDLILPRASAQPSFTGRRIAVSDAGHMLVSPAACAEPMQQLSPALLAVIFFLFRRSSAGVQSPRRSP